MTIEKYFEFRHASSGANLEVFINGVIPEVKLSKRRLRLFMEIKRNWSVVNGRRQEMVVIGIGQ